MSQTVFCYKVNIKASNTISDVTHTHKQIFAVKVYIYSKYMSLSTEIRLKSNENWQQLLLEYCHQICQIKYRNLWKLIVERHYYVYGIFDSIFAICGYQLTAFTFFIGIAVDANCLHFQWERSKVTFARNQPYFLVTRDDLLSFWCKSTCKSKSCKSNLPMQTWCLLSDWHWK